MSGFGRVLVRCEARCRDRCRDRKQVSTFHSTACTCTSAMRSGLVPRQNVRRKVYKLDQPTLATEAPARVLGRCLRVVATAKTIARPNATENAAKIKRGAITCSLLDHLDCINLPRSIWFRSMLGEIGAVKNVMAPFVNFHDSSPHRCDER